MHVFLFNQRLSRVAPWRDAERALSLPSGEAAALGPSSSMQPALPGTSSAAPGRGRHWYTKLQKQRPLHCRPGQERRVRAEMDTSHGVMESHHGTAGWRDFLYAALQPAYREWPRCHGPMGVGGALEEERTLSRMPACCVSDVESTREGKTQV